MRRRHLLLLPLAATAAGLWLWSSDAAERSRSDRGERPAASERSEKCPPNARRSGCPDDERPKQPRLRGIFEDDGRTRGGSRISPGPHGPGGGPND